MLCIEPVDRWNPLALVRAIFIALVPLAVSSLFCSHRWIIVLQSALQTQPTPLPLAVESPGSASNVAYWSTHARRQLEEKWNATGSDQRQFLWTRFWGTQSQHKDWYRAETEFLQHLLPRLPTGAHCLELGPGRTSLAVSVQRASKVHSLLSIDISQDIVSEQKLRHASDIVPVVSGFDFEVADALNLHFSGFKQHGWQRFDVVFEKAGLFDIHRRQTGLLQRLLACIVTEAFEPSRGGTIITLIKEEAYENSEGCADCVSTGLIGAVSTRPDFNCTVTEKFPVTNSWLRTDARKVVVVECGGISDTQAAAGCEAVWLRQE